MTIVELMKKRRSIRRYKISPISRHVINRIIEAASYAPSGLNRQPWFFVAVTNSDLKEEIRQECEKRERRFYEHVKDNFRESLSLLNLSPVKSFLTEAPYLVVVFGKKGEPYWKESIWISIGYMILKIEEEGLVSLTYTPPEMSFLNKMLNMSNNYKAVAILPVGYPDEKVDLSKRNRKLVDQLAKFID
jgi:nitroreductase